MIKKENYFDNCATTRTDDTVADIIREYACERYFNPSSLSEASTGVFNDISKARETIINALGGKNGRLVFTSSGSEADNTAIFGAIKNNKRFSIVTSMAEHPAVFNSMNALKSKDFDIRYSPLNSDGSVNIEKLSEVVDKDTQLVCLMHVNNETGAITDVKGVVETVKRINPKALVMADGVQAFMKIPVDLARLGVDIYTVSAHKIHALKGTGGLWIKNGVNVNPLIYGGGQENGYRSGTENVVGIMAFAQAVRSNIPFVEENAVKYGEFKKILSQKLAVFEDMKHLCGSNSSPNIFSVVFKDIKSEVIMHMMEDKGFIVGTGSACSSKHRTSRIGEAINLERYYHEGLIRISFSKHNTEESVNGLADALVAVLKQFRGIK